MKPNYSYSALFSFRNDVGGPLFETIYKILKKYSSINVSIYSSFKSRKASLGDRIANEIFKICLEKCVYSWNTSITKMQSKMQSK